MPKIITEDMIEQAAIKALQERHNYTVLNCMTEEPDTLPDGTGRKDKKQVVLPDVMLESLCQINPDIPEQTVRTVVDELCHTPVSGDLMLTNYQNYQKIRNGITVEYNKDGKKTSNIFRLLSYNDALSNTFTVASQMWIKGETHWRRPDLIIFINGFPLVFIELKNSNIPVKNAYDINLKNYLKNIPYLFNYNQICVLSNGMETRLGSFAAGYEFFFEWLKVENEKENPDRKAIRENCTSLEYFIAGLCEPKNLLDYIENFILYDRRRTKIIAKNHQFFGVNNAYDAFLHREELKGKLGVFWHTQGSGKSYSMVMLARKIKHKCIGNFTFLIVTDREDLDTQIYKNFLRTEFITDKDKVQPANSKQLREELKTNKSILFTLIHKFRYDKGKKYPVLSERDDIIVIVDEAHRTQYKDLAENMRTGLPNAQFLAFTGTPLLGAKRLTNAWFGDYVSEYNFAESIKDNATVPLYYVKRVPEVELQNDFLDSDFAEILEEENLTDAEQRRLENHYAKELEVIKRDDRLDAIAQHIVYHFPRRGFRGKGMVISVDKFTAVKMYDKVSYYWKEEIKNLNAQITKTKDAAEKLRLKDLVDYMCKVEMAVVISEDADEEAKFAAEGLSIKPHRDRMNKVDENGFDIEDNFKDPNNPLQLVFVCAMWLTGFDAPSVSTLYLDKPMKGHTLMQTIARANRVYNGKECGLIIDYLDVFKYLKRVLADYASDDGGLMPVRSCRYV
jgi:type I restriction enzyme R subunit